MGRVTEMFSKAAVRQKVIKTQVRSNRVSMGRVSEIFNKASVR